MNGWSTSRSRRGRRERGAGAALAALLANAAIAVCVALLLRIERGQRGEGNVGGHQRPWRGSVCAEAGVTTMGRRSENNGTIGPERVGCHAGVFPRGSGTGTQTGARARQQQAGRLHDKDQTSSRRVDGSLATSNKRAAAHRLSAILDMVSCPPDSAYKANTGRRLGALLRHYNREERYPTTADLGHARIPRFLALPLSLFALALAASALLICAPPLTSLSPGSLQQRVPSRNETWIEDARLSLVSLPLRLSLSPPPSPFARRPLAPSPSKRGQRIAAGRRQQRLTTMVTWPMPPPPSHTRWMKSSKACSGATGTSTACDSAIIARRRKEREPAGTARERRCPTGARRKLRERRDRERCRH